jgi:hypothetical protein
MTSPKQIEANRRNALHSTGPATDAGKQRSRRNAIRHGLTAETVITTLEDEEDYKAFELSVTSGYDAPTAVERELVLRLASLLWRLRRATAIDTGLLQLQSDIIGELGRLQDPPVPGNEQDSDGTLAWSDRIPSRQSDLQCGNDRSDRAVHYIARNNPTMRTGVGTIPAPRLRFASYGSPTSTMAHLNAPTVMRRPSGAKSAKFCSRSISCGGLDSWDTYSR